MFNFKNLEGVITLSKNDQREIKGGIQYPEDDECGWPLCRNDFGRCSFFACPDSI